MLCLVKDQFLYIKVPKNGCTTYTAILKEHSWKELNLFENDLDLTKMVIWGHLTNPETRHTRGVAQYVSGSLINYQDPKIAKMLISGVFDEHTFSLNMMLGWRFNLPINWIPLDANIYNYRLNKEMSGNDLTNDFFKENGINIDANSYEHLNVFHNNEKSMQIRKHIDHCKKAFNQNYQQLVKNFLEPDILLYNKVVELFRKKYV